MADRRAKAGIVGWVAAVTVVLAVFCLVAQLVAQTQMREPYSLLSNAISDLGATQVCQPHHRVCSPLWWLVDASLILFGLSLVTGAVLIFGRSPGAWWGSRVAGVAMLLSGLGLMTVGVFRENLYTPAHVTGAVLGLGGGNLGAIFAGWALLHLRGRRPTAIAGIVVGSIGLLASLLTIGAFYLVPAWKPYAGGVERVATEPMLLMMALTGGSVIRGEDVVVQAAQGVRRVVGGGQRDAMTNVS